MARHASIAPNTTDGMRDVRVGVLGSPQGEFLVPREHGVDDLVQDVVSGLAEERGVRVQCLGVFSIESRDVPQDLFPAGARFDQGHPTLLFTQKCTRNARRDRARLARRLAR
jgi:hypothetical protein